MKDTNRFPDPPSQEPVETLSFESAFSELQQIVSALEDGEQSLENALGLYERGKILARHCAKILDQSELKIKTLSGEVLADFDLEN